MESIRTSKEILKEWVEAHMTPYMEWTGTYIGTKYKCESMDEFIDELYEFLENNHYRC